MLIKINNGVADQKNAFADQKNNSADHFTNSRKLLVRFLCRCVAVLWEGFLNLFSKNLESFWGIENSNFWDYLKFLIKKLNRPQYPIKPIKQTSNKKHNI